MERNPVDRRSFLKRSAVAAAAALSFEERHLLAALSAEEPAAPSPGAGGRMRYGKIKHLTVSRLFCGGNLIGGWAHSRDLIYVSSLVQAYHTVLVGIFRSRR